MNSIVYNEDCMEGMKRYKDKHFDLAIVDPPYGIKHDSRGMSNRASNSKKYKNYKGKQFKGLWDSKPENKNYFNELKRISKNQIIWGANHFINNIPNNNSSCWIVWNKNGQNPNSTNADCELAYTSFKTAVKYFYYEWSGFGFINNGVKNKIHPTQKPVKLYEWLLHNYANEGDLILDTHLGSGSSRIACHKYGFDFTGFELDKEYYEAQEKRYNDFISQLNIFDNKNIAV